jgi:hypothetical protein
VTFIPAETVSYRSLVEALGLLPLKLARCVEFWGWMPQTSFNWQWILCVVGFYLFLGVVASLPFGLRRRTTRCT